MKTKALLVTGINEVELTEVTVPEPGRGEVAVESLYSAISPGTELRCMVGKRPGGTFPFIPGYSMVGRVAQRGPGATLAEGTLVFCRGTQAADRPLLWGAHVGKALLAEDSVFVLPPGVDPFSAVLAKLAAIAYRGVRCGRTQPHHEVALVGLGPIGQLSARLHRLAGARVVAADLSPERVAVARAYGIEAIVPAAGLKAAFEPLQPLGADVVVDATGAPSVLQEAIKLAKAKPWDDSTPEPPRLVVQGSFADNVVFDYHQAFARELSVHFPRDSQSQDVRTILGLLQHGRLKTADLLRAPLDPSEAPRVYAELRASKGGLLTAVFQWSPAG